MTELTQKQQDIVRALAEEYGAVEDEEREALFALLAAYEERDRDSVARGHDLGILTVQHSTMRDDLDNVKNKLKRVEAKLLEPVQVFLSRRNLLTLLAKLDRVKAGGESGCTLNKHDTIHPVYPQSHPNIAITALEDENYYINRMPGWTREDL